MNGVAACQQAMEGVGAGIGASLRGVDCAASAMAQAAFNNIFAEGSAFGPILTISLTLFVAFIGFGLLTGRLPIRLSSFTPRMVTLIAVTTFASSWFLFQTVFWNMAVLGPDWIASTIMGTDGSATTIFADKLDVVMLSLMEASGGEAMDNNASIFSPPGLLWAGGTMLLLGTVGVLATCKIALAILMGLGPIFIVLALFNGTRGLFVGWLRGVALLALAPLFAVIGGSLMLELAVPVLASLMETPGRIDVRPAMAFFMIGAVHLALMFMVLKVATTMVSGWTVFGLARDERSDRDNEAAAAASPMRSAPAAALASSPARERIGANLPAAARDIRVSANSLSPANDTGSSSTSTRETRVIAGGFAVAPGNSSPSNSNRARGIGSRFKSAPMRNMEKSK